MPTADAVDPPYGAVVELDLSPDEPIDLFVNGASPLGDSWWSTTATTGRCVPGITRSSHELFGLRLNISRLNGSAGGHATLVVRRLTELQAILQPMPEPTPERR